MKKKSLLRVLCVLGGEILLLALAGCPAKIEKPALVVYSDPLSAEEHATLGAAYEREGNLARAFEEYAACLKKDPKNLVALTGLGNISLAQKKWKTAANYYQRALEVSPDNPVVWNNLAMARLGDGDLRKALAAADRAVGLDPRDPRLLETRAEVKTAAGDHNGAKADLDAALAVCAERGVEAELKTTCERIEKPGE